MSLLHWLCEAWFSSLVRTLTVGGFAIVLFWLLDRGCRSLSAMQRSWLWRLLYIKIAVLLVCSTNFLILPIAQSLEMLPSLSMTSTVIGLGDVSPIGEAVGKDSETVTVETTIPPKILEANGYGIIGTLSVLFVRTSLMVAWLIAVLVLIGTSILRYRSLIQCLRGATVPTDAATQLLYRSVVLELGIANGPELRLVNLDISPCLVWDRHACVVLPSCFFARYGRDACRMAMAHELGHFVRRDLHWNGLVTLVSTWLFFFPPIWLMNKRYRLAVEMACDAYTIDRAQIDRHSYANLLVGLLDARSRWAASTTFVAMAGSGSFRSLSTRLNAMKLQRQGHTWLRRLSLGAVGCVVCVSLLPWGFADEDETKQKRKKKSSVEKTNVETSALELTKAESTNPDGAASSSANSEGSSAGSSGGFGFAIGSSSGSSGTAGESGRSAGGGSASGSRQYSGNHSFGESISKTTNIVDGKRTMSVEVSTKTQTIRIREDNKGAFHVDIEERTNGKSERKVYAADSRKEFIKTYPDMFAKIQTYLQDHVPLAPVGPMSPMSPVAPLKPLSASVVAGFPLVAVEGVPLTPLVEGKPLTQAVAGLPILPAVPTIAAVPAIPAVPAPPATPAPPALKGVLEALDKIRAESAGNAEIERLIESIKAKIDDKN